MKKILVIIPYFGSLPPLFKFWLQSAYNNPQFNFLIITDQKLHTVANVKVLEMSFSELKDKISQLFRFSLSLESPYKLCDFKPAYGLIFKEYIQGYDFWGFGDIDLVYGNLHTFVTEDILERYTVISGWGHLTLYKNNKKCNTFFMRKEPGFLDYKTVFSTSKNCAFDEYLHRGVGDLWKHCFPDEVWDSRKFDDIRIPQKSFNFVSEFHPEHSNNLIFRYANKQLYRIYSSTKGEIIMEPTMYAHFQRRKFLKIETNNTENYLIIPNKIINEEEVTTKKCTYWGRPQELNRKIWNLKNKIKAKIRL